MRVVATRFVNTLTQEPVSIEYLPVGEITGLEGAGRGAEEATRGRRDRVRVRAERRGAARATCSAHYLNIYIYYVLLNAKASEQSARMVSMKNATDNAEELIKELTLEYNKLRQGNITRELLEIAGGQAAT